MVRNPPKGVVFTGNDRYEGFTIDLLNRISQDLSFKYEIVLSPGNEYGAPKSKRGEVQEWGGIVGEILAKVNINCSFTFTYKLLANPRMTLLLKTSVTFYDTMS